MKGKTTTRQISWPSTRQSEPRWEQLETPIGLLTVSLIEVSTTPKKVTVETVETFTLRGDFRHKDNVSGSSEEPQVSYHLTISLPNKQPYEAEFPLIVPIRAIGRWLELYGLGSWSKTVVQTVIKLQAEFITQLK